MLDRIHTGIRIMLPVVIIAAIALAAQAGMRWVAP